MKKLFYILLILILIIFTGCIHLFLKNTSDFNHMVGIDIILGISIFITILSNFIIFKVFQKNNFTTSNNYREDIKHTFSNAFIASSIVSIACACMVYGFLENILEFLELKTGLINYCVFASKIWFISSPFIGLELSIIKYYFTIEYYQKPIFLLILKSFTFFIISFFYYSSQKANCFIYAKPICDLCFLIYYSKICFEITLEKLD